MNIKLVIAGIKWSCKVPNDMFNELILSFASDFIGSEDIKLEIKFTECFDEPTGQPITSEILEWYNYIDGNYKYHLIKKDDNNGEILASLRTNEVWSEILIEAKYDSAISIELINILLVEIVFRNRLLFHDGLVIHASALEFDGEAILFTAPSGTGKSTHVSLWQEHYRVKVINDDHPAVRIIDGKAIVFGTPWAGEAKKFSNMSSPLKGVVVLEQAAANTIMKLNSREIIRDFLPRCFLPYYNNELLEKAGKTFTELIHSTQVYKLSCKPDQESVAIVKNYVWSNK